MYQYLLKKFQERKWEIIILFSIIVVGIFLRSYNFRDWLYFGADQAHDARITGSVADGISAWPLLGADMGNTNFFLGPMYYYFQIISAKIFGNRPEVLAYPDLFFSILSIPLFYFFLKRYFDKNISLTIAGLYSISFYIVRYSRFAWNPNPMPFFVLLFLFSFLEFIENKEKTKWIWIVLIGISMGVGVQLHAMLLMVMPGVSFFIFLFLMKKNWRVWDKWVVIFLIVMFLNLGQVISETKTNYANSKAFWYSLTDKSGSSGGKLLDSLKSTADCHVQANIHIVSSLGEVDNCTFYYTKLAGTKSRAYFDKIAIDGIQPFVFLFFGFVFSIVAYGLFGYRLKTEKDQKKRYFLGLILLYLTLYFIVMTASVEEAPLRYFMPVAFAPFFFLGFIFQFISEKFPSKKAWIISFIAICLVVTNFINIRVVYKQLSLGARSSYKYMVLGEAERMVDYMKSLSGSQKEIYLTGKERYVSNCFQSLRYIAEKQGLQLIKVGNDGKGLFGVPVFHITQSQKSIANYQIEENRFETYQDFGDVSIFKVKN